jgi:hypothetical protein
MILLIAQLPPCVRIAVAIAAFAYAAVVLGCMFITKDKK